MASDTMPAPGFFEKHRAKIAFAGPDDCWLWTGGRDSDGYGSVSARGKNRGAHREAYEAANGEGSADGVLVRHRCDVPPCVNPRHLETGTHADNARDRDERGRRVAPKGSAHGAAKITDADVRAIRAEYVAGSRTHGTYALARRFGIDRSVIGRIIRRVIWRHI